MSVFKLLAILFILLILFSKEMKVDAQADTAFWFAAPAITPGHAHLPILIRFSTYNQTAIITISEPANPSFIPYTFTLAANSATAIDLTSQVSLIENKPANTILNYGIKIVSTATISAYYEEEGQVPAGTFNNPEIFPLKGRYALGKSFIVPSQNIFNNKDKLNPIPQNGFIIVATQDNTTVTITLSDSDAIGHLAGIPFNLVLNKGQTYAVTSMGILASEHLGGTSVKSDKPICITIFDDSVLLGGHYDVAGDQIVAEEFAGNEFIIVRGDLDNTPNKKSDYYFIWGIKDATIVNVNGVAMTTINRGQCYSGILSTESVYITTSNPAYVLQFTGTGQEVTETSIPGIKCTGSQIVSFVRSTNEYFQLDILCKSSGINNFKVNGRSGVITGAMFSVVPNTLGVWEYARINSDNHPEIDNIFLSGVAASVTNTSGLFHLGFLNGQNGTGSRLGYFSSYGIGNFAPAPSTNVCINNDIHLQANLIAGTTYSWIGPNGFSSNIYNPIIVNAQTSNSGLYLVTATVPGCGVFTDTLSLIIYPTVKASFEHTKDTICSGVKKLISVSFIGKAPWTFAYSDGNKSDTISNIKTSPYTFSVAPTKSTIYTINYLKDATFCSSGSVNINSSMRDTIVVNPRPNVVFENNDSLCIGKTKILSLKLSGKSPWNIVYYYGNDTTKSIIVSNPFSINVSPKSNTIYSIIDLLDGNFCSALLPIKFQLNVYNKPITSFLCPSEVCLRDTVFFKDKSTDSNFKIIKWNWNFSNNTSDSLQNTYLVFTSPKSYTIALSTINNAGCPSDTLTKKIIVNPLPKVDFSFDSNPLCETRTIPFKDNSSISSGNIIRWNWNMGNNRIIDTTNNDSLKNIYSSFGNYKVKLVVASEKGCLSDTLTKIIKINPLPKVGFIVPEICLQDAVATFKDTSSIADNTENQFKYNWSFDASTATPVVPINNFPIPLTSIQKNPVITYHQFGQYFVSETVSSNMGCKAFKTMSFVVNGSNPKAGFSIFQPSHLCSNDSVRLTNTSSVDFGNLTKLEIYWDYANNQNVKDVIINPIPNNTYTHLYPNYQNATGASKNMFIHIKVFSGGVCGNEITNSIDLLPSPKTTFQPVLPICNNAKLIDLNSYTNELSGISKKITYLGQGVDSIGNFYPQNALIGNNQIVYKATAFNGCKDTASRNILVLSSPSVIQGYNQYVQAGNSTELSPLTISNSVNYNWTPITYLSHNHDSTALIQIPISAPQDSIVYILTVTNKENECQSSDSLILYILHQPIAPNAFSPNGDGINDTWILKNIEEYPNPIVQIFDRNGQNVYLKEGRYKPWDGIFNGRPLPIGTYYYIVNPRNGQPLFSGSVTIIR